jgi:hypothetical protein
MTILRELSLFYIINKSKGIICSICFSAHVFSIPSWNYMACVWFFFNILWLAPLYCIYILFVIESLFLPTFTKVCLQYFKPHVYIL